MTYHRGIVTGQAAAVRGMSVRPRAKAHIPHVGSVPNTSLEAVEPRILHSGIHRERGGTHLA